MIYLRDWTCFHDKYADLGLRTYNPYCTSKNGHIKKDGEIAFMYELYENPESSKEITGFYCTVCGYIVDLVPRINK